MDTTMRFDLVSLSLFVAVAETQNLTHAARRKHTAVSAVSKRIAELEQQVGTQLMLRLPRGITLTIMRVRCSAILKKWKRS